MSTDIIETTHQDKLKEAKAISILYFVFVVFSSLMSGAALAAIGFVFTGTGISMEREEFLFCAVMAGCIGFLMPFTINAFVSQSKQYIKLLAKDE